VAFLALDIGSTELKAALYGQAGNPIAYHAIEYPHVSATDRDPGLDPEVLWKTVREAIASVVRRSRKERVRAAAISSHGESFVPINKAGEPLRSFLLNVDSRATAEMQWFVHKFGVAYLYKLTGLPPHPMYTLPKIAWLRANDPRLFGKAKKFLCVEDYLLHRAGVDACIGSSLAARTLAMDLKSEQWSPELLDSAGISEAALSRIVPAGQPLGTGSRKAMQALHLPKDTVWISGGHDQSCGALGGGALWEGNIVVGTGTFESLSVPLNQPLASDLMQKANIPCGRHAAPGGFLALAYAPGGILLRWFRDQFGQSLLAQAAKLKSNVYDLLLQTFPQEPTGLLAFPYFLGTGTPWLDSEARGAIVGLTSTTSRETMMKALLEGVTFEVRWNLELLESAGISIQRIFAVGGGAKSSAWLQLKADIFGREVVVVPGEASCRGAAICAAVGNGTYKSHFEAVRQMVKEGPSYYPRPDPESRYRELFSQYKEIARKLYGFEFPALHRVSL